MHSLVGPIELALALIFGSAALLVFGIPLVIGVRIWMQARRDRRRFEQMRRREDTRQAARDRL